MVQGCRSGRHLRSAVQKRFERRSASRLDGYQHPVADQPRSLYGIIEMRGCHFGAPFCAGGLAAKLRPTGTFVIPFRAPQRRLVGKVA